MAVQDVQERKEVERMKQIKILGSGCKNCLNLAEMINRKAGELGVGVELEKVTDIAEIMGYGVMSTPAVVIDGTVIHAGGMPDPQTVVRWLEEA